MFHRYGNWDGHAKISRYGYVLEWCVFLDVPKFRKNIVRRPLFPNIVYIYNIIYYIYFIWSWATTRPRPSHAGGAMVREGCPSTQTDKLKKIRPFLEMIRYRYNNCLHKHKTMRDRSGRFSSIKVWILRVFDDLCLQFPDLCRLSHS